MGGDAVRVNDRYVKFARAVSRSCAILVIFVGASAFTGWVLGIPLLKGFHSGITMKANTAAALLLSGASLWLLGRSWQRTWPRRSGEAFALLAGAIGLATLSEHLFGWNLGIDELLFAEEPGAPATASPGRMGPPASLSFTLAGWALLLLHRRGSATRAQLASVAIGFMALLALTGYAYGAEPLYGVARYTGIALHTALALLVLSAGLVASSLDRGAAAILAGDGAGSLTARRLLGFAVAVPLALGWVRILLEQRGLVDVRFGIALLMLAIILVLAALIVRTAFLLNDLERRKLAAEAQLRDRLQEIETMMEVLPVGLLVTSDASAERITGNRAAREILRAASHETNLSLSASTLEVPIGFRVLQDGVERPPEELPVQRAAREGTPVHGLELEVVFDDGLVKHELISVLPLLDEQGRPRGAVASLTDVTARKAAEKERAELLAREQQARADAEAANRAKDEFIAVISHELRTPLNAILGWASLLREGVVADAPARAQVVTAIERSCKAQAHLIEDLLDDARILSGRFALDSRPIDLAGVAADAAEVVRPDAEAKGVELRLRLDPGRARVVGDPARLEQVVWNLLTNAVRFSAHGSVVEVQVRADGAEAVLSVSDHGEGICVELLPYVFDRFRQGRGVAGRHRSGLGLGLSIARDLVEMHGGWIEAESEGEGRGACFTVRLPLFPAHEPPPPPADDPHGASRAGSWRGAPRR
jgi:signal transduction histidine kinase